MYSYILENYRNGYMSREKVHSYVGIFITEAEYQRIISQPQIIKEAFNA